MSYQFTIKPLLDRLIAFLLLLGLIPLWLPGIAVITIIQGAPLLFAQLRTGYRRTNFMIYKIRTLENSNTGDLALGERSFSPLGKILRYSSLDELPQLYNVLKGEMSLVGPRPMPVQYEHMYSELQKERFNSKPGITGWAQVNGRNSISWEERFKLDNWYVENISFLLDIKILGLTFIQLFAKQKAEMSVFTGSENN